MNFGMMNFGMITLNRNINKAKLCYMDTDSFTIHIKTEDFYKDIPNMLKNGLTHLTMMNVIKDRFQ